MYKTISNKIIRQFNPCYDPSKFITDETEELTVKEWVEKYRNLIPTDDIIWLLLRKEFLSEKDLRLFAVWCAREALKFVENPDERSVEVCNVAERYANGQATKEELDAARNAANDAAYIAVYAAYEVVAAFDLAAASAASDVVYAANYAAAYSNYYATKAAYYAASDANYAAAYANYAATYVDACIARTDADSGKSQIDQLLTYFE
jgi:hypothetical protein